MVKKSFFSGILGEDKKRTSSELKRAHKKAEKIVEKAVEKSGKLMDETKLFDAKVKAEIRTQMRTAIDEITGIFKTEAEKNVKQMMSLFSKELKSELVESQKELDTKVMKEYETAKAEIEAHKKKKIECLEEDIGKRVDELARQVLGRALSPSDHEKLVIEALEKAKREGVI